jgi:hypothetical protein
MQHLTEVFVDSHITPGVSVAHPRKGVWPACMPKPDPVPTYRWAELSAGRALELGAVPCTETACAAVTA